MARSFSASMVGIGSALFSAAGLLSTFANLGLSIGLVRFVPEVANGARRLVNSVALAIGVVALFASLVFMGGAPVWSPALGFLTRNYLLGLGFMILTAITAVSNLFDFSFIARRSAKYTFWKNLIVGLAKIPLPGLVFFALGGYGIFLGNGLAVALAVIVAFTFFMRKAYPPQVFVGGMDFGLLLRILPFSLGNYLETLFIQAIGYVLPLMVLNVKGAEINAYFYVAWMMASVIAIVPNGVSISLFAECSHHPERLSHYVKRSLWLSLALLVPAVGIEWILTPWLLGFFGHGYAAYGAETVRWLLFANFPLAISSFYNAVNQVRKKMTYIILQAFAMSVLTLGMSYLLLIQMGLPGIGIAYALANLIVALVVAVPLWRAVMEVPRGQVMMDVEIAATSEAVPANEG